MEAKYYTKLDDKRVRCTLCPHACELRNGQTGFCLVRSNSNGILKADTHNLFSALSFDAIEKKPLYHFFPGKKVFSIGTLGCNMKCSWCQNCEISQAGIHSNRVLSEHTPQNLLETALAKKGNIGIAFTYNEPGIAPETNLPIAKLFNENGLKNVMVTNGFLSHEALIEHLKYIDAFNLDIKAFNPKQHKKYTRAELSQVLENAITIYKSGAHLELTYLVVPGVNDKLDEFQSFVIWVRESLGVNTPIHISRYFPRNNFQARSTSKLTLNDFASLASQQLNYVYLGNTQTTDYTHTICPTCKSKIIHREGYFTRVEENVLNGSCTKCDTKIYIEV